MEAATPCDSALCTQTESPRKLGETDSLLPRERKAVPSCCRPGYRARRVRSKGAVLVLVWSLLPWACYASIGDVISQSLAIFKIEIEIVNGLGIVVTAVLYLLAGWLADVYFGRYKVMKVSIWVMWWGSVCGTLLLMIHLSSPHDALKYVSIVVAYVCISIGSIGLNVNTVPFGTDQMLGASSEEISAFIHWFVWAYYTGNASGHMVNILSCTGMRDDQTSLASMLFAVAISSIALCLDFLCRN